MEISEEGALFFIFFNSSGNMNRARVAAIGPFTNRINLLSLTLLTATCPLRSVGRARLSICSNSVLVRALSFRILIFWKPDKIVLIFSGPLMTI